MSAFTTKNLLCLTFIFVIVQSISAQAYFDELLSNLGLTRFSNMFPDLWVFSLLATMLVSAAPLLVIFLIPDLKSHRVLLNILLAFAAGGLLGDAFLHLIPHSIDPHDHDDAHSHEHKHNKHDHGHSHSHGDEHHDHSKNMLVGLWVVAGIMSFLCVEKFVRLVKGGHGHSHNHVQESKSSIESVNQKRSFQGEFKNSEMDVRSRKPKEKNRTKSNDSKSDLSDNHFQSIKVSGYLNLVADFAHNFTDGLAIGASFLVNKNVGIVTTITILFHEVPHEIGDYAILIQSGCSRKKAILLQLVTAVGAMLGTILSLLAKDIGTNSIWILPFTAGGFIYISTVSVLPELLKSRSTFLQSLCEIAAMVTGVGMMVAIAYFE